MTKMEKKLIEKLERACQTEARVTVRLIRKLEKENEELKLDIEQIKTILLDFIPHSIREVELKTKLLKIFKRR